MSAERSVFVSYRRDDSKHAAGRLGERLHERFRLFMDIDSIRPGADFTAVVRNAVDQADIVLAVIGTEWLGSSGAVGTRRIDDPEDWVALEVGTALKHGTPVIPVLVDGAKMPDRRELPPSLAELASRQAITLKHESFAADCTRLIDTIEGLVGGEDAQDVDLWADPDYPAARSALLQGQWARGINGLERVLRRHPRQQQVLEQLADARRRLSLVELDRRARDAALDGRWGVAVEALEGIQALQPSDEVAERLAEARRQQKVRGLQHDVRALAERGEWVAVVAAGTELAALDADAADVDGLVAQAREELLDARLADDYRRGLRELDAGQWADGEATFAALLEQKPGYRDCEELVELARGRGAPAEPEPPATPAKPPAKSPAPPPRVVAPPVEPLARASADDSTPGRSMRAWMGAAAVAVVLVGGVVTGVVLATGDDSEPGAQAPGPGPSQSPTQVPTQGESPPGPPPASGDELVAASGLSVAPPPTTMAMASRTAGVQVDGLAPVTEFGAGDSARSAPEGGELRAFHLTSWGCDVEECKDWSTLDLKVVVDGETRRLPDRKGTYVVAIPAGATSVDLVTKADDVRQSLSLLTGAPGPDNLSVLGRADRVAEIGAEFTLTEQNSRPVLYDDGVARTSTERQVTIESAELRYFLGKGKPRSPHWAFLVSDVSFVWPFLPDARYRFTEQEIRFRAADGTEYELVVPDEPGEGVNAVFEVPADISGGTFLLGGRVEYAEYTVTLSTESARFRF